MSVSISPVFNGQQFFNNDGTPLNGGKLFQYEAGSYSVEQTTYADSAGATPNANPIVLDSSGRLPDVDIWLTDGLAYNLVLTKLDGVTILTGVDNVVGVVSSTTAPASTAIWVLIAAAPTYINGTTFLVPGNVTTEFTVGNRVQVGYTGPSFRYGTVSAVSFSSPNTQVTIINDGAVQDSGMQAVYWSLNVVNGKTVDAGAVTYEDALTYPTPATVGYQIKSLIAQDVAINARVDATLETTLTTGTSTAFVLTPAEPVGAYTPLSSWMVQFHTGSGASPTLNISGVGAKNLTQYNSAGATVFATVGPTQISRVVYNSVLDNFVVLDALPAAAAGAAPHGQQIFSSNGTFTVPSDVYSVKVTVVGGGGGGGSGWYTGFGESTQYYNGGQGGTGGSGVKILSVTPAATHSITIGAAGVGGPSAFNNGTAGGSTTFGASLVVATGGGGGSGTSETPGANGYGSVADYGYYGVNFQISSSPKGLGGAGGTFGGPGSNGSAGMIIVEW